MKLVEVRISESVLNEHQSLRWTYVFTRPLPEVAKLFSKKFVFNDGVREMNETRALQCGTAWGSRTLKDRNQTVILRRGRYVLHEMSDELLQQEEGWTKIVVSESVLLGKSHRATGRYL